MLEDSLGNGVVLASISVHDNLGYDVFSVANVLIGIIEVGIPSDDNNQSGCLLVVSNH